VSTGPVSTGSTGPVPTGPTGPVSTGSTGSTGPVSTGGVSRVDRGGAEGRPLTASGRGPGSLEPARRQALESVLAAAQQIGLVGPGPIQPHIDRALDLAGAVEIPSGPSLDLGSGAGLPGLPLALAWPATTWFLLEVSTKRARFLGEAVAELHLTARVSVLAERAEDAGRGEHRGGCELVVARSFGSPAVTAECGAPFLTRGGRLIVAEPPGGVPDRWEPEGLAALGLRIGERLIGRTSYQILIQDRPCPERFPRRVGIPSKRPLF
jgi:16S rRNA (guanine527-N7)-methyltransferase